MRGGDETQTLRDRVRDAAARRAAFRLRGSGSKDFLGNAGAGEVLDLRAHAGIVRYAPRELVITARAGTRLHDLEAALAENAQMLAFEPPHFGRDATLGGTIACGLSGPRRANGGAARDFVLGVRILDGRGEVLRFGGEVIKNVAGYDVSRLMTGAFGTLGILLDLSLRVVPCPRAEETRVLELDAATALQRVRAWSLEALPISASAIFDGRLFVRLSGANSAVRAAAANVGGEALDSELFWHRLREHDLPFFAGALALWRLSVAPGSELADLGAPQLIEWHGAQRWVRTDLDAAHLRAQAQAADGHATLFRAEADSTPPDGRFHPLPAGLFALHRRLKAEFDPHGVFNPGRLYPGL
jgi:glycolate oxidase FAD binding subunit